jgi:hypothetical protein
MVAGPTCSRVYVYTEQISVLVAMVESHTGSDLIALTFTITTFKTLSSIFNFPITHSSLLNQMLQTKYSISSTHSHSFNKFPSNFNLIILIITKRL